MDDVVNRFARELADAIAGAVAEDAKVEACRERARAAGFEMRLTLEAVVGFSTRQDSEGAEGVERTAGEDGAESERQAAPQRVLAEPPFDVTENDRRFLRSLRIASDETTEEEVE